MLPSTRTTGQSWTTALQRTALHLLLALAILPGCANAGGAPAVWRLGFYWSPTAATYSPALLPWSMYSHVSQMAILPTAGCGIDENAYLAGAVKAELVRAAHAAKVKITITLMQDEPLTAIIKCTQRDRIADFVAVLAAYVKANGYDGVDLDWEGEVVPSQFQDLVRRLRQAMPGSILTADIAMHQRGYLVEIQDNLDRINVMNYDLWTSDYHGRALKETWHHAALLSAGDRERHQTAEAGIAYVLDSGIKASKVNLAVPFYGYAFQGCQKGFDNAEVCKKALSAPLEPIGRSGIKKTQVEFNKVFANFGKGVARWDAVHKTPYITYRSAREPGCTSGLCVGDAFVTYTDERQMVESVDFLVSRQLGGIMTFALHQEFMKDRKGAARYPLSSAIYNSLALKAKL